MEQRETRGMIKWIFRSSSSRSIVTNVLKPHSPPRDITIPGCAAALRGDWRVGGGGLHPLMACCRAVQPLDEQPDSVSLLERAAKDQRCPGREEGTLHGMARLHSHCGEENDERLFVLD